MGLLGYPGLANCGGIFRGMGKFIGGFSLFLEIYWWYNLCLA